MAFQLISAVLSLAT